MPKYILLLIVFIIGCHYAQTNDRQKAIELNNKAVELYNKFYDDTEIIKYILQLYDEAIEADSLYEMAYINKSNLLIEFGRCEEALQTLDRITTLRKDLVSYWSMSGYILEAMGQKKEAEKRYRDDISKLDSIIENEQDSLLIYFEVQRAFLLLLIEGKIKGIREYEKLKTKYPDDQYIISQELLFETFDRQKFISNYCK